MLQVQIVILETSYNLEESLSDQELKLPRRIEETF